MKHPLENDLAQAGTPGPAGHKAVILFFSMNRYISVGGGVQEEAAS